MGKQYRIIESRPATYYWEYVVEADSENEALSKVFDGEVEAEETWCDVDNDEDDSEFEVYPADDNDNE
jgi:hypothetical protein